jgi:hypothetical protein
MKVSIFAFGILLATGALGSSAQAQNYPWCATYGGRDGGGENCGFVTFQQCLATLSGMGGFCNRNTQYVPPPGPLRPPRYYYQR